ncbi:hypothetical protein ACTNDY_07380 [Tissierellaceae bacterium HCP3S3_D8]
MKRLSKLAIIMSLVVFVMVGFIDPAIADNMPEELEGEVEEKVVEEPVDMEETDKIPVEDKEDADLELEEPVEDEKKELIEGKDKIDPKEDIKTIDEPEDKKAEEIEEDKKVEVQNIAPLSEKEHDYNFRIRERNTGNELPKQVIMKKREDNPNLYEYIDLPVQLFYEDENGDTKSEYSFSEGPNFIISWIVDGKEGKKNKFAKMDGGQTLRIYKPCEVTLIVEYRNEEKKEKFGQARYTVKAIDEVDIVNEDFEIQIEKPDVVAGDDLNIKAIVANISDEDKNALFIAGLYDKSNTMITYAYSEKEIKIGETIDLGAGFKLPENSSGYKVKIFVWDSWESKNPISDITEIEIK